MRASCVYTLLVLTLFLVCCAPSLMGRDSSIGRVTVTAESAPIMQGSETLTIAKNGETFDVIQVKGPWYGILGGRGWIHRNYVRFVPLASPRGMTFIRVNDEGYMEYRNEKDGSILVRIPAGKFTMGASRFTWESEVRECPGESPPHPVHLDEYYIGKYEVTNAQFREFVNETGYNAGGEWKPYAYAGRETHPVIFISWSDAVKYAEWAGLRLPTEAEWERAAKGTDARQYPWGDRWDRNLCNNWLTDRSDMASSRANITDGRGTTPVGSFPGGASPCGVMDMAGNVYEWCSDWSSRDYRVEYAEKYKGKMSPEELRKLIPEARNPTGLSNGDTRILRGSSWACAFGFELRCTRRFDLAPDARYKTNGFRTAR